MKKKKQDYTSYISIIVIVVIVAFVIFSLNQSNIAGEVSKRNDCRTKLIQANQRISQLESELSSCQTCELLSCGTDVFVNDVFNIGECSQFQYRSADAMTKTAPVITFKNLESGETLETALELRVLTRINHEGVRYHFWSDSDYNVDNFVINLVAPCENIGVACLVEINQGEEFVLGGDRFQYLSADRFTKTSPILKFRNIETGQTVEMALKLSAVSHISHEGRRYHFESDTGTNYNLDNFRISLFDPCN